MRSKGWGVRFVLCELGPKLGNDGLEPGDLGVLDGNVVPEVEHLDCLQYAMLPEAIPYGAYGDVAGLLDGVENGLVTIRWCHDCLLYSEYTRLHHAGMREVTTIRLLPEVKAALERAAKAEDRSVAYVIERATIEWLRKGGWFKPEGKLK